MARFDVGGSHLWSQQITPGGLGLILDAMTVAPDGSIYVAGLLQNGDIDFGGSVLSGAGVTVLAALESDGSHRWSFVLGSARVRSLAASNAGVACTGYSLGSVDLGGGALGYAGGSDIFIGLLNADGSHRFSQVFGDAGDQGGMSTALDPNDGVVLAAATKTAIDFGGGVLTPTATDLCLSAFNATGVHQWSWIRAGSFSAGSGILLQLDVEVSGTGEIALAGQFRGSTDLGGGTLNSAGLDDAFLARYSSGGGHLASQAFGGTSYETVQGVSWDGAGNLVFGGSSSSATTSFGGGTLTHSGGSSHDGFVAVFDDGGSHLYSTSFVGIGGLVPRFQASGQILCFGSGSGNIDFGGGPVADPQFYLAQFEGATSTTTAAPYVPAAPTLAQNIPNPFNPSTTIRFSLDEEREMLLEIFDVAGRRVRVLVHGAVPAGDHVVSFDGRDARGRWLASGVYRYRLRGDGSALVRSMVLVR